MPWRSSYRSISSHVSVRGVPFLLPDTLTRRATRSRPSGFFSPMQIFEKLPSVSGKLAVQGSKITMELPRIAGVTRDQRAYELTAETAVQDITKPDVVELQNLRAKMELQDSDVVVITAKSGTYNTKGDHIVLREHVLVTSANGYNAKLTEASVDMKKGNVQSDRPVEIKLPNGVLTANSMEIVDSGDLVRFTRGVVLNLEAESSSTEAKEAKR